jgi:ADP-heptose:LPS heptosyltransferase
MVSLMENVIGESGVRFGRASQVVSLSGNFHAAAKTFVTLSPSKKLWVLNPKLLKPWHHWVYPDGAEYVPAWEQYRAQYYFDIMPCAQKIDFRPPQLRTPPSEWRHPGLPEHYILLHPTSAWPGKSWTADKWSLVLNALHDAGHGPFLITGGPAEWERAFAHEICKHTKAPTRNLAGKTNLRQYIYAVAHAQFLLCVDGSSSHLAPAFRRPSITLFGNTPHRVWHLSSEFSSLLTPPMKDGTVPASVENIPVESVIELALQKLRGIKR